MHELGLAEGILSVTRDIAGEREVRRVTVRVGALQRVVPDSLEFGFRLLAEGTPAADACLDVVPVNAVLRCGNCGAESEMTGGVFGSPACGSSEVIALSGEEILVDEVEIGGDQPEVVRRPGLVVTEQPHELDHDHIAEITREWG
jgi:hydrogenase nickel incorporation protein HypA/HybF